MDESLLCNQTQRRNFVDYNKFTFGKEGGSYCIVNVTSKYSWNVSTSSTWCHISEEYKTDKSFKVYVDRNDGAPREATIIVYGEDMNETIKIYQE